MTGGVRIQTVTDFIGEFVRQEMAGELPKLERVSIELLIKRAPGCRAFERKAITILRILEDVV